MMTENIAQNNIYPITENNRPISEAIDMVFTYKTIKERDNQVKYSFNDVTNELLFEKGSMGRATVFMDKDIIDLSIDGQLDWVTLYTDPVGYRTFGFYAKDPSRLGYVSFTNYNLSGYEFETNRPEFSKLPSEKIRFQYDGEGWNIYDEDTLLGKITPKDFPLSSAQTSEMIPMIGFKLDANTTFPYSIKVKGYNKSTDKEPIYNTTYNFGGKKQVKRDYQKTQWVAYETVVSADSLNNIENELEYVSTHTSNNDIHITVEERSTWNGKANASDIPTLNNTVTSTSTTEAATANAVKTAYDRAEAAAGSASTAQGRADQAYSLAEQAFQSASDGKNKIANAVTGKGIPTSASDTFEQMANNINAIKLGYEKGSTLTAHTIEHVFREVGTERVATSQAARTIVTDSENNFYIGTETPSVKKYNSTGGAVWTVFPGSSSIRTLAVDGNGGLYIATASTISKYSTDGGSLFDLNGVYWQVAVDNEGYVYGATPGKQVRKFAPDGNIVWTSAVLSHKTIGGLALGKDEVFVMGETEKLISRLWKSNGGLGGQIATTGSYQYALASDNNNCIYYGGSDMKLVKYDANRGSTVYSTKPKKTDGSFVTSSIYSVGVSDSGVTFSGWADGYMRKLNKNGTTSFEALVQTGKTVMGVSCGAKGRIGTTTVDGYFKYFEDIFTIV